MVRKHAAEMAQRGEYPTAESVRRELAKLGMTPSNTTITDEIKKWYADTFWPTYHALAALPQGSEVPGEIQRLFNEAFRMIAVQLLDTARRDWNDERAMYQEQLRETEAFAEQQKQTIVALESEGADVSGRLRDLQAKHDVALEANTTLRNENTQMSADLNRALQQQASHERELNEAVAAERRRADATAQAASTEQKRLLVEIDGLRQTVKRHEAAAAEAAADAQRSRDRAAKTESELAAARAEVATMRDAHGREIARLTETIERLNVARPDTAAPARKVAVRASAARPVRTSLRKSGAR